MGSVPTLTDLARNLTSLSGAELEWLHSLVSDWQLLADLSFADLIFGCRCARPRARTNPGWVAVAQMRPTTGPTSFPDDVVGTQVGTGRAAGARHRAGRAAHPPGERPRLDIRRPGAGGGHPGDEGRAG